MSKVLNLKVRALLIMIMALSSVLYALSADARDHEKDKKALKIISDFADSFCKELPLKGSEENKALSADAKVKVNKFVKIIADIGFQSAAKYQQTKYNGLLQKDLAVALNSNLECRSNVLNDLSNKLIDRNDLSNKKNKNNKAKQQSSKLNQLENVNVASYGQTGDIIANTFNINNITTMNNEQDVKTKKANELRYKLEDKAITLENKKYISEQYDKRRLLSDEWRSFYTEYCKLNQARGSTDMYNFELQTIRIKMTEVRKQIESIDDTLAELEQKDRSNYRHDAPPLPPGKPQGVRVPP